MRDAAARHDHGDLAVLAERALAALTPLQFALAVDASEREEVLRMRGAAILAAGWARADELPGGRERDEYDDAATFVVCRDAGALAGSMRIVLPASDRPLPTERAFGIRARPVGRVADVGRVIVAPGARSGLSHRIVGGLSARGWLELAARGFDRAISSATPELIGFYGALGLRVTVLGPPAEHWGERRVPVGIEGDERSFDFLTA